MARGAEGTGPSSGPGRGCPPQAGLWETRLRCLQEAHQEEGVWGGRGLREPRSAMSIRPPSAHQLFPAPELKWRALMGGGSQDSVPEGPGEGCENQRRPLPALPLSRVLATIPPLTLILALGHSDGRSGALEPAWTLPSREACHPLPGSRGGTPAQSTETKSTGCPLKLLGPVLKTVHSGWHLPPPLPDSRQGPGSCASRLTTPGCWHAPSLLPPTCSRLP